MAKLTLRCRLSMFTCAGVIMFRSVLQVAIAIGLCGCASSGSEIKATYVSPLQYNQYNCQQLAAEAERVSRRAAEASGVQDSKASSDAVVTAAAIVVFWPAAFFVKGDGQNAAELARLKGEFDAIERASIDKSCGIKFQPAKPAKKSDPA